MTHDTINDADGHPFLILGWELDGEHILRFKAWKTIGGPDNLEPLDNAAITQPSPSTLSEAEPWATGFLKWDGCCNLTFPTQERGVMLHLCHPGDDLAILTEAVYARGKHMPAWYHGEAGE